MYSSRFSDFQYTIAGMQLKLDYILFKILFKINFSNMVFFKVKKISNFY